MDKIKSQYAFIAQFNANFLVFIAKNVLNLVYVLNAIPSQLTINMNLKKMFDFQTAKLSKPRQKIVKIVKQKQKIAIQYVEHVKQEI